MFRVFSALLILTASLGAQEITPAPLRAGHPRLMWTYPRVAEVKAIVVSDPLAKRWHETLVEESAKLIAAPPITYTLENKKLLNESRQALRTITTLAGLYRTTGDPRFADRARKEIANVCSFPDWNPANFLATAEMTTAVAIGYDWIFETLPEAEKATIRQAIVEKGLKPGLAVYARKKGWHTAKHNWNSVCNNGLIIGALAIADTDAEVSSAILAAARKSLPFGYLDYAPDGGWPEGPGYWDYGTSYAVLGLAAMQSALATGDDFARSSGFSKTGDFRIQLIAPSGMNFNFADAPVRPSPAPCMFWLAARFGRPDYDAAERLLADGKPDIFHLVWFNPKFGGDTSLGKFPVSQEFKGVNVAVLRSGREADATFLGIKGGSNQVNHAHLDLGTFVLESGGQRFTEELGADDYTLPGYFGAQRWTYYRLRTEGQNTLVIGGQNQETTGRAPLVSFSDDPATPAAEVDLTKAYPGAKKIIRSASLGPAGTALLEDRIELDDPSEIVWSVHTKAKATVDGRTATLSRGKITLKVEILAPEGATFTLSPVIFAAPQRQDPKVLKLAVQLPAKSASTRIAVRFSR